jgi:hypothetical protein
MQVVPAGPAEAKQAPSVEPVSQASVELILAAMEQEARTELAKAASGAMGAGRFREIVDLVELATRGSDNQRERALGLLNFILGCDVVDEKARPLWKLSLAPLVRQLVAARKAVKA